MTPLALAAAVSPTVLTVSVLILSSKDHSRLRAAAYLVGAAAALIVIGVIAVRGSTAAGSQPAHPSVVSAVIDIFLGLLLVVVGARQLRKPPKPQKDKEAQAKKKEKSLWSQLMKEAGLGVVMIVTDFSSLVFYIAAAKQTADAKLPAPEEILPMGVVALGILAPIILPLGATIVAPAVSRRFLDAIQGLVKQYGRYITAAVAFLFAVYLLYKGSAVLL